MADSVEDRSIEVRRCRLNDGPFSKLVKFNKSRYECSGEVREQNIYATRRSRNLNAAFPFSPPPGRPFPGRNERKSIRFRERPRLLPALFAVTSPSFSSLPSPRVSRLNKQIRRKDGRMSTKKKIGKKRMIDFEGTFRTFIRFIAFLFFLFFFDRGKPRTMTRATGRRSIDTVGRMFPGFLEWNGLP